MNTIFKSWESSSCRRKSYEDRLASSTAADTDESRFVSSAAAATDESLFVSSTTANTDESLFVSSTATNTDEYLSVAVSAPRSRSLEIVQISAQFVPENDHEVHDVSIDLIVTIVQGLGLQPVQYTRWEITFLQEKCIAVESMSVRTDPYRFSTPMMESTAPDADSAWIEMT